MKTKTYKDGRRCRRHGKRVKYASNKHFVCCARANAAARREIVWAAERARREALYTEADLLG